MRINIPGLNNSNKGHWQTKLEESDPSRYIRIEQKNWGEPDCETWIQQIEDTLITLNHSELILIGHSIGCIAIVHWFEKFGHKIKGAMLVAPSDAEKPNYPNYIRGFAPIPKKNLPFPSVVVASDNDHVTDLKRSNAFAENWGSELIVLKNAGHIEPKGGFHDWEFLRAIIERMENN